MQLKIIWFFIVILTVSLHACQLKGNSDYVNLHGTTMGTTYHLIVDKKEVDLKRLALEVEQRLKIINQQMSTYIANSEISRFNQEKTNHCFMVSNDSFYVIKQALTISRTTQGAFDITVAPLITLWGFDNLNWDDNVPSNKEINTLLHRIGYQKLTLGEHCIGKQNPRLSINLSAIAKGYAVDEIAKLISQSGVNNYLVEIGGEIANHGVNAKGHPWVVAIESASEKPHQVQKLINPKGMGVATSGDYRNYFEKQGKRFSHTIDPNTGYPVSHNLAAVTVLHSQTMIADALATAMMVMGAEAALAYAVKHQLPIFMLVRENQGFKELFSPAFYPYLTAE